MTVLGAGANVLTGPLSTAVFAAAMLPLPVALAVAIRRYRLYEIDVLTTRALVYAALTAVLGATYALAVVVAETVLVIALFGPARHRIQRVVDRRFYRTRYAASRVLDASTAALRDEVDLDELRAGILRVVAEAVRPTGAGVWLREERS